MAHEVRPRVWRLLSGLLAGIPLTEFIFLYRVQLHALQLIVLLIVIALIVIVLFSRTAASVIGG